MTQNKGSESRGGVTGKKTPRAQMGTQDRGHEKQFPGAGAKSPREMLESPPSGTKQPVPRTASFDAPRSLSFMAAPPLSPLGTEGCREGRAWNRRAAAWGRVALGTAGACSAGRGAYTDSKRHSYDLTRRHQQVAVLNHTRTRTEGLLLLLWVCVFPRFSHVVVGRMPHQWASDWW